MSIEFDSLPRRTQYAWQDVETLPCLAAGEPLLADNGEFNQAILFDEALLRVPRGEETQARAALEYESEISFALHDANYLDSPLALPRLLEINYCEPPYYMILSRLPGVTLSRESIRQLSVEEKISFGSSIGTFIAWYAKALDVNAVERLIKQTRVHLPDRASKVRQYADLVITATDIDYVLGDLLLDNHTRYMRYNKQGLLTPSIVGHDDLHPGNMVFEEHAQGLSLHGVFDLGSTKPSIPERELRHMAALGPEVLEAAIRAYEIAADTVLSRELIDFWAVLQESTVFAFRLLQGDPQKIAISRTNMQILRSDSDWSQSFAVA